MTKRIAVWFSLCVLAAVACATLGCNKRQEQEKTSSSASSTKSNEGQAQMATDSPLLHPDTLNAKAPELFDVKFETTRGDFVVAVHRAWAPLGADRFYNLVKSGFFTGEAFFRVVPGFVVQFGLSPDPAVNRAWRSADIKDDPVKESNKRGTITFATAGPNTRTTQLFINFADNSGLDRQGFAPFGLVTSGMDVVDHIYSGYGQQPDQGAITTQGAAYLEKHFPKLDTIKSATVVPAPAAH
jgi:peptidyl-prolyl cis-trans isomerase A (cyclophilin A)